jgi:hypothetical protein
MFHKLDPHPHRVWIFFVSKCVGIGANLFVYEGLTNTPENAYKCRQMYIECILNLLECMQN